MEESVLLGTKPLVDSIRHFIRDPSDVFSVCHLCECRIVPWRHNSRLLHLLNWFLHIIKRTLHVGSKIWILNFMFSWQEKYRSCHSNIKFISSRHRVISSIYLKARLSAMPLDKNKPITITGSRVVGGNYNGLTTATVAFDVVYGALAESCR